MADSCIVALICCLHILISVSNSETYRLYLAGTPLSHVDENFVHKNASVVVLLGLRIREILPARRLIVHRQSPRPLVVFFPSLVHSHLSIDPNFPRFFPHHVIVGIHPWHRHMLLPILLLTSHPLIIVRTWPIHTFASLFIVYCFFEITGLFSSLIDRSATWSVLFW